ncbi:MAG: hypothetical protein MZV65_14760 [Chromatiales bacterium]|nr:hypothetical protein [Chromatiales bacterium]
MKLDAVIDDKTHRIDIPAGMLEEGGDFFARMDHDMDHGWQMGPEFVENPDALQRCQIAANKLLTAHAVDNKLMMQLMAAYILKRLPGVRVVNIDTDGEMLNTEFLYEENAHRTRPAGATAGRALTADEARAQVEKDVSQVYKVGKAWRFATFDRSSGQWIESPFLPTEEEAQRMRTEACNRLLAGLQNA